MVDQKTYYVLIIRRVDSVGYVQLSPIYIPMSYISIAQGIGLALYML